MKNIFKTIILNSFQKNYFSNDDDDDYDSIQISLVDIILYIILSIQIILNIIGLFVIIKSTAKFRFELTVLVSGIIECSLNFCFNWFRSTVFSFFVQFFQTGITLYITERFLKLYYLLSESSKRSKLYDCLFVSFVLLNLLACIFVLLIDLKIFKYSDYVVNIELGNNIFGFLCSFVLFIFGLKLNGVMDDKLTSETKKDDENEEINQNNNEIEMINNNYFIETRKRQLLIIMYAKLFTATFEMVSCIFRKTSSDYNNYNLGVKLEEVSYWVETFSNFFAFFFLIRKGFHNKSEIKEKIPEYQDLLNNERNYSTADISNYLG